MGADSIFEKLYGNSQLKSYLIYGITEKKLPHALVFEGADGSGKKTVALMTAAAMDSEYSDKILKLNSPDVTLHGVESGKKSIGVSVIRALKYAAYIKPQELSHRVFIIDDAHLMTEEAQNALLKILEEPPENVYFFLLCENVSVLLATVRSRAPSLKMEIFDDDTLSNYLISFNPTAAALSQRDFEGFRLLVRSSEGAIGAAEKRLLEKDDGTYVIKAKTDELLELLSKGNRADILMFFYALSKKKDGKAQDSEIQDSDNRAEQSGKGRDRKAQTSKNGLSRDDFAMIMSSLSLAVRDMLAVKYGTDVTPIYFPDLQSVEEMAAEFPKITLVNIHSAAEKLKGFFEANVNVRLFAIRSADMLIEAIK